MKSVERTLDFKQATVRKSDLREKPAKRFLFKSKRNVVFHKILIANLAANAISSGSKRVM